MHLPQRSFVNTIPPVALPPHTPHEENTLKIMTTYTGPDRRKEQRRKNKDRREMIRFELEKTPRRSGKDRRQNDVWNGREMF